MEELVKFKDLLMYVRAFHTIPAPIVELTTVFVQLIAQYARMVELVFLMEILEHIHAHAHHVIQELIVKFIIRVVIIHVWMEVPVRLMEIVLFAYVNNFTRDSFVINFQLHANQINA